MELGEQFGLWTVVAHGERGRSGRPTAVVRCTCGAERTIRVRHLRTSETVAKGCGCQGRGSPVAVGARKGKLVIISAPVPLVVRCDCGAERRVRRCDWNDGRHLTCGTGSCTTRINPGDRFGRLVVLGLEDKALAGRPPKNGAERTVAHVRCDCGAEKHVRPGNLVNGNTDSCGCLRREKGSRARGWKGVGVVPRSFWNRIEKGARDRKLELSTTLEHIAALYEQQGRRCALTGWEIGFGEETTASLDRIDSSRGYVDDNVQWVHKSINKMKLDHAQEDFVRLCRAVADHNRRTTTGEQLTLLQGGKRGA